MTKAWGVFLAIGLATAAVATVMASPELRGKALAGPAFLQRDDDLATKNLRVFDTVWSLVDQRFYDRSKTGASWDAARAKYRPKAAAAQSTAGLYYNVLNPMLRELGTSHVQAEMPPGSTIDWTDPSLHGKLIIFGSAHGENICEPAGFDCAPRQGRLTVIGVRPGSEAARNGVRPGAIVVSMSLPNGKTAAHVKLDLLEQGARRKVEYVPSPREAERRTARPMSQGVLFVRFDHFDRESVTWALDRIASDAPRAVVLDLRFNGGGSVAEANRFMEAFLPHGAALGRDTAGNGRVLERVAHKALYRYDGPVAVLVGPFSNSSAEAVAAVFRHHERACLLGLQTPGNVLMSLAFDLPDGGKLQLPWAEYRSPSGEVLEGVGVTPDVEIMDTPASLRSGVDLAAERAAEMLLTGRCAVGAAPIRQAHAGLLAQ